MSGPVLYDGCLKREINKIIKKERQEPKDPLVKTILLYYENLVGNTLNKCQALPMSTQSNI